MIRQDEMTLTPRPDYVQRTLESVKKERDKYKEGCRQARACLLNLMPDDNSPMRQQMAKMVDELNQILE
jgi:hypothetical protein